MMRCIVIFFEHAKKCINESLKSERKISWAIIQTSLERSFLELSQMKFKDPLLPQEEMAKYFDDLADEIENDFRKLMLA
jgi:V-type H+-transporting ATPase subunit A